MPDQPCECSDTYDSTVDLPNEPRRGFPYLVWSAIAALLLVLQHISNRVLRDPHYQAWPYQGLRFYVDGWSQFDGHQYIGIAQHGYWYTPGVQSPIAWFPVFPLAIRAMNRVVAEPIVAGIAVSSLGGLAAVGLYWNWLRHQGMAGQVKTVAFLFLLTYPYAWYLYGVVYSDAVFLALAVGAFLLIEQRRLLLAGVIGAFATAARPTGMALLAAMLVLSFERGGVLVVPDTVRPGRTGRWVQRFDIPVRVQRSAFHPGLLLPLVALTGLGLWMLYLGLRFGDPLAFHTNQTAFHPGNLPWLKLAFFVRIRDFGDSPSYALTIVGQAIAAAVVLLSTPFVGRRFGWGYAVYGAVLVAIPTLSTEDFMGTGRYLIAAFPTAALLGEWLSKQAYRWWWLGVSGALMTFMSMGFARSWYLS